MNDQTLMILDVEKMLRTAGIWKILKVQKKTAFASGSSYKLLSWDMIEDLQYDLHAVGIPFSRDSFPCFSKDYTCITYDKDGAFGAALISSSHGNLLWVNSLYIFRPDENHTLLVMRKFLTELYLADEGARPQKLILLPADPKVASIIRDVLGEKSPPEEYPIPADPEPAFFSSVGSFPSETVSLIHRDFYQKLRWMNEAMDEDSSPD